LLILCSLRAVWLSFNPLSLDVDTEARFPGTRVFAKEPAACAPVERFQMLVTWNDSLDSLVGKAYYRFRVALLFSRRVFRK
jgi:hypothetical protein